MVADGCNESYLPGTCLIISYNQVASAQNFADNTITACLLYPSDAADDLTRVYLGGCPRGCRYIPNSYTANPLAIVAVPVTGSGSSRTLHIPKNEREQSILRDA